MRYNENDPVDNMLMCVAKALSTPSGGDSFDIYRDMKEQMVKVKEQIAKERSKQIRRLLCLTIDEK